MRYGASSTSLTAGLQRRWSKRAGKEVRSVKCATTDGSARDMLRISIMHVAAGMRAVAGGMAPFLASRIAGLHG